MKLIGKIFKSTLSFKDAPCLGSLVKQGKQVFECKQAQKMGKYGNSQVIVAWNCFYWHFLLMSSGSGSNLLMRALMLS